MYLPSLLDYDLRTVNGTLCKLSALGRKCMSTSPATRIAEAWQAITFGAIAWGWCDVWAVIMQIIWGHEKALHPYWSSDRSTKETRNDARSELQRLFSVLQNLQICRLLVYSMSLVEAVVDRSRIRTCLTMDNCAIMLWLAEMGIGLSMCRTFVDNQIAWRWIIMDKNGRDSHNSPLSEHFEFPLIFINLLSKFSFEKSFSKSYYLSKQSKEIVLLTSFIRHLSKLIIEWLCALNVHTW